MVSSASTGQKIDLDLIVKTFRNVEYRPEQFPGLVFRLDSPKTAILIFGSGKMVCTGAKSEEQSRQAVINTVKKLRASRIIVEDKPDIQVQNIVASANLGGAVDLEKSAFLLGRTMYEPEQFPGLIYRMDDPHVVILLFASGKLVVAGAKRESDVFNAVTKLRERLESDKVIFYK